MVSVCLRGLRPPNCDTLIALQNALTVRPHSSAPCAVHTLSLTLPTHVSLQTNEVINVIDLSGNHFGASLRRGMDDIMRRRPTSIPYSAVIAEVLTTWIVERTAALRPPDNRSAELMEAAMKPSGGRFIDRRDADGGLVSTTFLPALKMQIALKLPPPGMPGPPPLGPNPAVLAASGMSSPAPAPGLTPVKATPASDAGSSASKFSPPGARPMTRERRAEFAAGAGANLATVTSYPEASFRQLRQKLITSVLGYVAAQRYVIWEEGPPAASAAAPK